MNIAIVIDSLITGGAERQAVMTAAELGRCGHKVHLISYRPGNDFMDLIRENGIHWVHFRSDGLFHAWRMRDFVRHFRRHRFDVVHGFGGYSTISSSISARLARVPAVFGGYRVEYQIHGLTNRVHRLVDRLLDGWIVNSEAIADSMADALDIDRRRFIVIGNVVNCEAFRSRLSPLEARRRLGLETNGGTVSIIAGLRPQKNHALFVQMAALLLKERPETKFLIVGDGEARPSLEAQIRTRGIGDRVMVLGKRPDIPDILAATDVSVLTSHREGIPNALLESMAAGIPVVTTDYSGARELVTDGQEGCIVPQGDPAALARAVGRLLDDASLRATMGQQGRKTVETRFSGQEVSTALVLAYQRVLETSRR